MKMKLYKLWFNAWPITKKVIYYGMSLYVVLAISVWSVSLMAYGSVLTLISGAFILVISWVLFMLLVLREMLFYANTIDTKEKGDQK